MGNRGTYNSCIYIFQGIRCSYKDVDASVHVAGRLAECCGVGVGREQGLVVV